MKRACSGAWLALAALALTACSFEPQRGDTATPGAVSSSALPPLASPTETDRPPTPDEIPVNVEQTPDAIPKAEQKSATGNPDSYVALGRRYEILSDENASSYHEQGVASWYGKKFHGKRTSSGEAYDMFKMTAAHKTLPIPCYVRVTNLNNGRSVIVRVNDRGPFLHDRIIDLSYAAAAKLKMISHGEAAVDLQVVSADGTPPRAAPTAVARASAPAVTTPPAPATPAVTVASAPTIASAAAPATATPRYLQAGSFADAVNAASLRARLNELGMAMVELRSDLRDGRYIYRVLIGPFLDAAALDVARSALANQQLSAIPVAN